MKKHLLPAGGALVSLGLIFGLCQTASADCVHTGDESPFRTAVGCYALYNDVRGDSNPYPGVDNTAIGYYALNKSKTASRNTAAGFKALQLTVGPDADATGDAKKYGMSNTAVGYMALNANTTGWQNTAVGESVLEMNTTGQHNTAIGEDAMGNNVSGMGNTASGESSLWTNTVGNFNVAYGYYALNLVKGSSSNPGSYNIAVGAHAGCNLAAASTTTGNMNNIYVGSLGTNNDSGVIRIGNAISNQSLPTNCKGADTRPYPAQTATYIAGISGVTVTGAQVFVNSNGQLGISTSSRRFKKDIETLGAADDKVLKLRPVSFHYRQPDEKNRYPLQYGLIAEEVAEIFPELVQYDAEGKPFSVYYQFLPPLLLAEVRRQHAANDTLRAEVATLGKQVQTQTARLAAIEEKLASLKGMTRADAR